jgi:iduronate 2-sulfatase
LFEESLHSPLIIVDPNMSHPGSASQAIVETVDIFPTLCDLTGLPQPTTHHGQTLLPQLRDPKAPGHTALGYTGGVTTLRNERYRFVQHKAGEHELYDMSSPEKAATNIANQHPDIIKDLEATLKQRNGVRASATP